MPTWSRKKDDLHVTSPHHRIAALAPKPTFCFQGARESDSPFLGRLFLLLLAVFLPPLRKLIYYRILHTAILTVFSKTGDSSRGAKKACLFRAASTYYDTCYLHPRASVTPPPSASNLYRRHYS